MTRLGFIGTGSLGSMLIRGFISRGAVRAQDINVINRSSEKVRSLRQEFPGLVSYSDHKNLVTESDLIFICVKPGDLADVLNTTGCIFPADKLVISTLLAPPLKELEKILEAKLVRLYPSVTQSTGRGVTIYTWGSKVEEKDKGELLGYLKVMGKYYELPEDLYRAAGDVTSCGPAFMAAMVGALAEEAVRHGLNPQTAAEMAVETMHGTAHLLEEGKLSFSQLIKQVATPGGCTAEGVRKMEPVLPTLMGQVYEATSRRQEEIRADLCRDFDI